MKKLFAIAIVALAFAACNGGANTEAPANQDSLNAAQAADSTAAAAPVATDSTAVAPTTDSTAAAAPAAPAADSAKAAH